MELLIFGRFHARKGRETELETAIRDVSGPTRAEPGCLDYQVLRPNGDARLFYIHSRWVDEAAFELHAALPHTVRFIELAETLIDHPLDITRTTVAD